MSAMNSSVCHLNVLYYIIELYHQRCQPQSTQISENLMFTPDVIASGIKPQQVVAGLPPP